MTDSDSDDDKRIKKPVVNGKTETVKMRNLQA